MTENERANKALKNLQADPELGGLALARAIVNELQFQGILNPAKEADLYITAGVIHESLRKQKGEAETF